MQIGHVCERCLPEALDIVMTEYSMEQYDDFMIGYIEDEDQMETFKMSDVLSYVLQKTIGDNENE